MAIFDLFFNKKSNNNKNSNFVSTTVKFNNMNIVYPKNNNEEEINKLYTEIRDSQSANDKLQGKYISDALKHNRYFQKQQSTFLSEKQKIKKMEDDFNRMLEKGDDIFKKD